MSARAVVHANAAQPATDGRKELVGNNPEKRNWKGILIAMLVILIVCGFVILAVVLLSKDEQEAIFPRVKLKDVIDETWKHGLSKNAQWVGDWLIWRDSYGNIKKTTSPIDKSVILISNRTLEDLGITDVKISADIRYALLAYNKKSVNSFSYNASYLLYPLDSDKATRPRKQLDEDSERIFQYAGFGPNDSQLIYILNGDIYYRESAESPSRNLTWRGDNGRIINGIANLQYEEHVFKSGIAHWFSPNGRYLAYASFDDTNVPDAFITSYSKYDGLKREENIYPEIEYYPYSKAGFPISLVNVHVVDLQRVTRTKQLIRPLPYRKRLGILHAVGWSRDSDSILITWSNRNQSVRLIQSCSPTKTFCVDGILPQQHVDSSSHKWISHLNQPYLFAKEPGIFFYILPRSQGGRGFYQHLAMVNHTATPATVEFLTGGLWEVTKLLHYDSKYRIVYYISNERQTRGRFLYQIVIESKDRRCLTCSITTGLAELIRPSEELTQIKTTQSQCLYYDAEFGSGSNWSLLHCLGPGVPFSFMGELISGNDNSDDINTLVSNKKYDILRPQLMDGIFLPFSSGFSERITKNYRFASVQAQGRDVDVKILVPAVDHFYNLPVIFYISDAGSQDADFRFRLSFAEYLVSRENVIVALIDGAGSSGRGNDILHSVAKQPGVLEVEDINTIISYFHSKWNIAVTKVGVMGSGYGGYVSALSVMSDDSRVSCGVAINPIIDWRMYSSYESEKVLGVIEENSVAYDNANLLSKVRYLKTKRLLVLQGMKDRLVDEQHSILLEQYASDHKLSFESIRTHFYPNQDNRLSDKQSKAEMYGNARTFFHNCLFNDIKTANTFYEDSSV